MGNEASCCNSTVLGAAGESNCFGKQPRASASPNKYAGVNPNKFSQYSYGPRNHKQKNKSVSPSAHEAKYPSVFNQLQHANTLQSTHGQQSKYAAQGPNQPRNQLMSGMTNDEGFQFEEPVARQRNHKKGDGTGGSGAELSLTNSA